jgi:hypothetical protein
MPMPALAPVIKAHFPRHSAFMIEFFLAAE